ncbi:hypothetical protein CK228_22850 [Mesorhizobium sp. WSM4312]|uniref:NAD(P)/FAD-dependent oxidoreductase n=1 Tax=Mesorhizobium sp. WSM4312 TaxID=2029411 RepID=UPI000BAFF873|nr:FAD-binding oxidoreductase [Mesorhizobium sp. WSM4312]PBB66459.1 hypothetical protein CK228_22850 [Mesorhizobium sp. WSM4312]
MHATFATISATSDAWRRSSGVHQTQRPPTTCAGSRSSSRTTGLPCPCRLALLDRGGRKFFPALSQPSSKGLGFRPSLPDSRLVIGPSARNPNVIYAFGHGHLGLTLAAATARLVADSVTDRPVGPLLAPFAPSRF